MSNVTARTGGAAPTQRTTSVSPATHQQQLERQRRLVQAQQALNARNKRTVV